MRRRARSIWERLALESSVEGPTVTISLPRELAQELVGALMGSLEMDGGGEADLEPDDDDTDVDADLTGGVDDSDPLAALIGGDGGGDGGGLEPDDDSDDDSDDDDDDPDEAADYGHSGGSPSGLRTQTALGERRRRELRRR